MDLQKMIADLQAERDRLDEAIITLERLTASDTKRRGRPPSGDSTHNTGAVPENNKAEHE